MKHTPGKWEVLRQGKEIQGDGGHEVSTIINGLPVAICEIDVAGFHSEHVPDGSGATYFLEEEEALANAKLIASAPELLEALKELKKQIFAHHKMDVKKDYSLLLADAAASKVINKVEGK